MKRYICLFAFFTFLVSEGIFGQVIITGKIKGLNSVSNASYTIPMDGFDNLFLNEKEIRFSEKNDFKISFKIGKPGFIHLRLPFGSMVYFFVQQNDKVHIELQYEKWSSNKYKVSHTLFYGSNKEANNICNNTYNSKIGIDQSFMANIFFRKKINSAQSLLDSTKYLIDSLTNPYNILLGRGSINKTYYSIVTADTKYSILNQLLTFYYGIANDPHPPKFLLDLVNNNKNLYAKERLDSFINMLYSCYDPLDNNILCSGMGKFYTDFYFRAMDKGILKNKSLYYNPEFNFLKGENDAVALPYLQGGFLEVLLKNFIYWSGPAGTKPELVKKSFQLFRKYFPNSRSIPFLRERIASALEETSKSDDNPKVTFVKDSCSSMRSLLSSNFSGSPFIFVDLWATWCVPCLEEFAYSRQLEKFMGENKIPILYISVDNIVQEPSAVSKWEANISKHSLFGFHVLATTQLVKDIEHVIYNSENITIPRYILADKNGNIINGNLPRPDNMNELKHEITKLLNKN
ncbi:MULTISPECIES: TlpA family protein disulfide reductase [Chitinophagaceae]